VNTLRDMDLITLVQAILAGNVSAVHQWIIAAERIHLDWPSLQRPQGLDECSEVVTAAIVELLAARVGARPPPWTALVGGLPEPFLIEASIAKLPRELAWAMTHTPEPLRKRNIVASPDFLRLF